MLVLNLKKKNFIFEALIYNKRCICCTEKNLSRGLHKELIVLEYPNNKVCNELEIKVTKTARAISNHQVKLFIS